MNPLAFFINEKLQMPSEVLNEITSKFEKRTILKGAFFLEAGKQSNEYLFLENGIMRAFTLDTEGNDVTTDLYSSGQMVFEVFSFFNRTISKESIQAVTDCDVYVIRFEELNNLFHQLPQFREFGRAMLVSNFSALKYRTLSLINETAEERYAGLLKNKKEILLQVPLKYIASYLGITDTSLSRIRRDFAGK